MPYDTPVPDGLRATEKQFVGRRVLVLTGPHANKTGTVARLEHVGVLNRWGFVVDYDDGLSGFVFHGREWKVLD